MVRACSAPSIRTRSAPSATAASTPSSTARTTSIRKIVIIQTRPIAGVGDPAAASPQTTCRLSDVMEPKRTCPRRRRAPVGSARPWSRNHAAFSARDVLRAFAAGSVIVASRSRRSAFNFADLAWMRIRPVLDRPHGRALLVPLDLRQEAAFCAFARNSGIDHGVTSWKKPSFAVDFAEGRLSDRDLAACSRRCLRLICAGAGSREAADLRETLPAGRHRDTRSATGSANNPLSKN